MKRDSSLVRLSRDHQRGLALAQRIQRTLAGGLDLPLAQLEGEVVDFWRDGLLPHFRAECECLLARLARRVAAGDELLSRTERDHVQVHALVTSLREAGSEEGKRQLLGELATLLREHIRWEEAVLFEAAQRLLPGGDIERLGADLAQRLPEVPPVPSWFGRNQGAS